MHIVRQAIRTLEVEVNLLQSSGVCGAYSLRILSAFPPSNFIFSLPWFSLVVLQLDAEVSFTLLILRTSQRFDLILQVQYFWVRDRYCRCPLEPDTFCERNKSGRSPRSSFYGWVCTLSYLLKFNSFVESVLQFGIQHVCIVSLSHQNKFENLLQIMQLKCRWYDEYLIRSFIFVLIAYISLYAAISFVYGMSLDKLITLMDAEFLNGSCKIL